MARAYREEGGGGAAPPALPRLAGAIGDDTQAPAWARDSISAPRDKGLRVYSE